MTEIGPFYLVNNETKKIFSSYINSSNNNPNEYLLTNESVFNGDYPEEFYLQHIKNDGYKFYIKKNNKILYLTQSTFSYMPAFTEGSEDTIKLHKVGENQFNIQLIGLLATTPKDIYRYQEYLVRKNDQNKRTYSIKNGMDTPYNQNRTYHTKVNLVFKIKPTDFTYTKSQDILNLDPITEFTNSTLPAPSSTTVSTPAPKTTDKCNGYCPQSLCWDGSTRKKIGDECCACPDLPSTTSLKPSTTSITQAVQNEDSNKTLPIVIGVLVSLAVIVGIIYFLKKKGYILNK